ncbi:MAG TPA: cytochrome c oxidase subunit II [Azospirillaceae bacterium]|nr:cytochrome c oxidase subunit II [Azospirillaceae bacterium]
MSVRKIGAAAAAFMMTLAGQASLALAQTPVIGAPREGQLGFQEAASPVMERLDSFHDLLVVIITGITLFVMGLLLYVMVRFNKRANPVPSKTTHHTLLEVAWTVIPVIILVVIAIPSFQVLYYGDKTKEAEMTIKVTGYQWYWGYEYPDHANIAFDSRMIEEKDLKPGQLRLLEVDNRLVLPVDTNIRILVTAADVIHAFAMPALGVKKDAVPGRLNETWTRITKEGVYYGQCSEICGTGHGYMPIAIEAVSKERFAQWVEQKKAGTAVSQVETGSKTQVAAGQ